MPEKTISTQLIDEVVALGISPILREHGYKKLRRHFFRQTSEATLHLVVQASQFNAPDRTRFTINLYSYLPAVAAQNGEALISEPQKQRGHAGIRIGHLLPIQEDFWWNVVSSNEVRSVAFDVEQAIREYALPYLNRISDLEGIAKFIGYIPKIGQVPTPSSQSARFLLGEV
ncbi:DUF4304 domain-containing protein [Duganella sp. FT109W]|uniref:DUF4304 domain-containing protein n=1 Tax=Duganella margarita TaxID=2692170 RepID=A0ABW9WCS6_9BURK|nr:DUF4304 domain-containing protein [Duganella margarita]MYN38640.1 DUF4304 domain-containing protein [Duganella margarita]